MPINPKRFIRKIELSKLSEKDSRAEGMLGVIRRTSGANFASNALAEEAKSKNVKFNSWGQVLHDMGVSRAEAAKRVRKLFRERNGMNISNKIVEENVDFIMKDYDEMVFEKSAGKKR